MIRIRKPERGPTILSGENGRGRRATRRLCESYDRGERTFSFDSRIYGAKSVRNALIRAQNSKCCFCESKITHVSYGDVEHFRPKGGSRQDSGDALQKPGYYWLAYDWSNLLLSCQLCNQRFKRNLFPLQDPQQRARSHDDDLSREASIFIDPSWDDPSHHIGFRENVAFPIEDSDRGAATIDALGLNRTEILEMRQTRLGDIRLALRTVRSLRPRSDLSHDERAILSDWEQWISDSRLDASEFAAMARAAIPA